MKEIGISEFGQLVMERLSNPRNFAGRSLLLWNADYMDYGIAFRVIQQCCEKYNTENPNDQVWFRMSDFNFDKEDYTQPETWCSIKKMYWNEYLKKKVYGSCGEWKRCGILFNTGCYTLEQQDDWLKFVNTHTNQKGGVFQDCAVIVCAQADDLGYFGQSSPNRIFKEEQFGNNCDIYSIQPSFDEWATWVAPYCRPEILKVVLAYIEKNGIGSEPLGYDYWQRLMSIPDLINWLIDNEGCSLDQMPKKKLEDAVTGSVTKNPPALDFCNFVYEQ